MIKDGYLWSVLNNKCPRCRTSIIFKSKNAYSLKNNHFMKMHDACQMCGQKTELEVGFYYGTGYVSYALTVAYSVSSFVAWWILFGFSIQDNSIFYWLAFNSITLIAIMPLLMRLSRSLWLSWFVKYDPDWRQNKPKEPERIVEEQMGNW
jgi:ribosomal protein S27AE